MVLVWRITDNSPNLPKFLPAKLSRNMVIYLETYITIIKEDKTIKNTKGLRPIPVQSQSSPCFGNCPWHVIWWSFEWIGRNIFDVGGSNTGSEGIEPIWKLLACNRHVYYKGVTSLKTPWICSFPPCNKIRLKLRQLVMIIWLLHLKFHIRE